MKSLDEVIKAWSICFSDISRSDCTGCPYADEDGDAACFNHDREDALHYLKELRDMTDIPMEYFESGGTLQNFADTSQITCPKCHSEFVILPEANNPLTWDELRTMEGKPVWVESHGNITEFTGWAIVRNALEDRVHFIFSHYDGEFLTYEMALPDVTFGKEWQVYRKEHS